YVDQLNETLNRWETIKRFAILDHDLTIEDGEITPNPKVKRKVVENRYRGRLDEVYERATGWAAPATRDGDPAPLDVAELAAAGAGTRGGRPFRLSVHVPFGTVRCGYCDFNTDAAVSVGPRPGASRATYAAAASSELRRARGWLGEAELPVATV